MVRSRRFWIIFCAVIALGLVGVGYQHGQAQTGEARYFPETGHWVMGAFLDKYEETSNAADLYGAPITEAFTDSLTGLEVQYFEKARFELHPESPADLQVRLSILGRYLYQESEGQPITVAANNPACRSFPEAEHPVCFAFLDFFEAHGGAAQFGYPVSGFEIVDGWIVQYFQKARLEWHPEARSGKRVTVSNLGLRYFYARGENPRLLNPVENENIPNLPTARIQAHAFVNAPTLSFGEQQKLYVIVQNQNLQAVSGAQVQVRVVFPNGNEQTYQASTSVDGVSTFDILIGENTIGLVNIFVDVTHNALKANTRTSFQLWY